MLRDELARLGPDVSLRGVSRGKRFKSVAVLYKRGERFDRIAATAADNAAENVVGRCKVLWATV